MRILIKPFLYLVAFGPLAILFASVRAGLLVADGVCPGHFLGKFHMAPNERGVGTPS